MSSFDIALVLDAGTLNSAMTQFFGNSSAQAKVFKGTLEVNKDGISSVDWQIEAAPQFKLAPPSQAQLDDKNTFSPSGGPKPTKPDDQMFQVELSSIKTTFNMDSSGPVPLTLAITVFAQVSIVKDKIVLSNVAVLPGNAGGAAQIFAEIAATIAYNQVEKILAGYQIPSTIDVKGQTFTEPVSTISDGYLVVASNLEANGAPDITGVTWPEQPLGVMVGRKLVSTMVDAYKSDIIQKLDSKTIDASDSNWTGSYSLHGGISNADIAVGSTLPNIDITVTFSATAEVGVSWWLVPAACAAEAGSNLLP